MSDHNERPCHWCGSLLHTDEKCTPLPHPAVRAANEFLSEVDAEMGSLALAVVALLSAMSPDERRMMLASMRKMVKR